MCKNKHSIKSLQKNLTDLESNFTSRRSGWAIELPFNEDHHHMIQYCKGLIKAKQGDKKRMIGLPTHTMNMVNLQLVKVRELTYKLLLMLLKMVVH